MDMKRDNIAPYIAQECFTFPGSYELFAITDDSGILCYRCCKRESLMISTACPGDGWFVVALDHTGNCDESENCDHCGKVIE